MGKKARITFISLFIIITAIGFHLENYLYMNVGIFLFGFTLGAIGMSEIEGLELFAMSKGVNIDGIERKIKRKDTHESSKKDK